MIFMGKHVVFREGKSPQLPFATTFGGIGQIKSPYYGTPNVHPSTMLFWPKKRQKPCCFGGEGLGWKDWWWMEGVSSSSDLIKPHR